MNQVIIAVGSNIEPWDHTARARALLAAEFELMRESRFIKTEPIGNPDQPDYVNGVLLIQTNLLPEQLKARLRTIEHTLGRRPSRNKRAPRTIDLDIVVWNHEVVDPDVYEREFLKTAVAEVCPDLVLS